MSKKDRRTHEQKRKAKLSERAKRRGPAEPLPYSGSKYRHERWTPHVYATELGVYETIRLSERRLTNEQARTVFIQLIEQLRRGEPALLPEDAPEMLYVPGQEAEYLSWNIRRHWGMLFTEHGAVAKEDLIGILRTLLYSIEAHAANTGPLLGYVRFIEGFIERTL